MNTANITKARAFLNEWLKLSKINAVLQLSALLALDWTQAETIYAIIAGA